MDKARFLLGLTVGQRLKRMRGRMSTTAVLGIGTVGVMILGTGTEAGG